MKPLCGKPLACVGKKQVLCLIHYRAVILHSDSQLQSIYLHSHRKMPAARWHWSRCELDFVYPCG
jgi:hypothetical protein